MVTIAGHPILGLLAAMGAGVISGYVTAFLQTRLGRGIDPGGNYRQYRIVHDQPGSYGILFPAESVCEQDSIYNG